MSLFLIWFFLIVFFSLLVFFKAEKKIKSKLSHNSQAMNQQKRIGGVWLTLIFSLFLNIQYYFLQDFPILRKDYLSIIFAIIIILFIGIWDDLKKATALIQILFQSGIALVFIIAQATVDHVGLPFYGEWEFSWLLSWLVTFFWFLLVINAFNWLDGVNGLAPGVSIIVFFFLLLLSISKIALQPATSILIISIIAILLVFLGFNFSGRLTLGSTGSLLIGTLMALFSIYLGGKIITLTIILILIFLDFSLVVFKRILQKQKPWLGGDRQHLHYFLIDQGYSQRFVYFFYFFLTFIFGLLAMSLQFSWYKLPIFLFLLALLLIVFFLLKIKYFQIPKNYSKKIKP
ncbi:MAG: hypothetical protein GF332_01335 [Candidatus Moranbacteria bacterium]|nr:hypothetical protein [Candidatus Moranbacteria bacterium]